MKPIRLLAFSFAFVHLATIVHATELHNWSKRFGDSGSDVVTDLAWSPDEGAGGIMTGTFEDTVAFGGAPLVSAGGTDVFLVRLNWAGAHVWSRGMGGASNDIAYAATSRGNSVYVAGSFEGTANFGGADLTSAGGTDIFIAQYDLAGAHVASYRFGGPLDDAALDIFAEPFGMTPAPCFVTGYIRGSVDFGGGDLTSAGGTDVFVAQFSPTLAHVWSYRYGGVLDDVGAAVMSNIANTAVVVGSFSETANFGGADLTSAGGTDVFYAQYGAGGVHQRSERFGGTEDDFGTAVAFRYGGGYFYITGSFRGTANFGGGQLTSYGATDAFLAAYSMTGVHQWSKRLGGPLDDTGADLAAWSDILAVTGTFAGTANLGGGPRDSAGGTDVFLAKFQTADGFHRSSQTFGGTSGDTGTTVAIHVASIPEDYGRDPVLAGSFRGAVDFGGGLITSAGESDGFVLDLSDAFTAVGDSPPRGSIVVSCVPNPFNPRTTVSYTVPSNGRVTVAVFDVNGARVATLVNHEQRQTGEHRVEWDGRSDGGGPVLASGVYFVRVDQLGVSTSTKLALLK